MEFIKQCLMSLGTGVAVGGIFDWLKLVPPSPPLEGVFGVLGLTLGFIIVNKLI